MSSNSLYCIPVKETQATAAGTILCAFKSSNHTVVFGSTSDTGTSVANVVRVASAVFASKSPFTVRVRNAAGGYTTYNIPGQKLTKIVFSRESSVMGNAALLNASTTGTTNGALLSIADTEDQVDIRFNVVLDSDLDE